MLASQLRRLVLPDAQRAELRDAINHAGQAAARERAEREARLTDRRRRALHGLEMLHADRVAGRVRPEVYAIREPKLAAELDACAAELATLDAASAENRTLAIHLVDVASSLALPMLSASRSETRRQIVALVLANPRIVAGKMLSEFAQPFDLLALAGAESSAAASTKKPPPREVEVTHALREPLALLESVALHADRVRAVLAA